MGTVWILTGTICLSQSGFLRDVAAKANDLLLSNSTEPLRCSHMHYKITCEKKAQGNINRFSVTSYTKGIQYVNCQAFPARETSTEILLAGA